MDSDKEILNFFIESRKFYKNYKDGGVSYFKELKYTINKSENKNKILSFLLNEISTNKHNFEDVAFSVFEDIYNLEKYNELFDLYLEKRFDKPNEWADEIFSLILKNQHKVEKKYVIDYINNYLLKNRENAIYVLVLFVHYGHYSDKALKYLSQFCIQYFDQLNMNPNTHITTFLFSYLTKNKNDNFYNLIDEIAKENNYRAKEFIQLYIEYVGTSLAKGIFSEKLLLEISETLKRRWL